MNANLSRRGFLQATAIGATAMSMSARSYGRIINANERIRLAQIGCGGRGLHAHMMGVHKHDAAQNVEYVAVADPWRSRAGGSRRGLQAVVRTGRETVRQLSRYHGHAGRGRRADRFARPPSLHATGGRREREEARVCRETDGPQHAGTAPRFRRGQGRRHRRAGRHANPQPAHQHRLPQVVGIRPAGQGFADRAVPQRR